MEIELDEISKDMFTVIDIYGDLVTGASGFTVNLFDPDGNEVSGTTTVTVTELSNGHYMASFIPDAKGTWALSIFHSTYMPSGITAVYKCTEREAWLARLLGLCQENVYIDNRIYSGGKLIGARLRTYTNAAYVGTTTDVLATYTITASYTGEELVNYQVIKS